MLNFLFLKIKKFDLIINENKQLITRFKKNFQGTKCIIPQVCNSANINSDFRKKLMTHIVEHYLI